MKAEDKANRQHIWEAAYAAAFVNQFYVQVENARALGYTSAFDKTLESGVAEEAITVADAAVAQLDDWVHHGRG